MVRIQAHTTRPATPHRTAERRWIDPTPTIAPVIVWVVDTGIPWAETKKRVAAAADSPATPPEGASFVIRDPRVWTTRHPPVRVPRAMALWALSTTHSGTSASAP